MKAKGGSVDASGPTIANGMVLTNSGYGQFGGKPAIFAADDLDSAGWRLGRRPYLFETSVPACSP